MAARPLDKEKAAAIVIDWRVGQLSQQDIADKHKVSKGMVNKLCKGVPQDGAPIVTAGVVYKQSLAAVDDRMVTAVHDAVDERTRHIQLFNNLAVNNAIKASNLPCETHQDHERLSNTLLRSKEVVLGKAPDTAIQVNNGATPGINVKFC